MDKINALNIVVRYLNKLKQHNINFSDAYLFGSYARGNQKANSDIDIAIVLDENEMSFDTEVKLMVIRRGEETLIEPHAFTKDEFDKNLPFVNQIIEKGERIKF